MLRAASRAAARYRAACTYCAASAIRNSRSTCPAPALLCRAGCPRAATAAHFGQSRALTSQQAGPPAGGPGDDSDEDDEFTSILALDAEEAERAAAAALAPQDIVKELAGAPLDMTPEQADALVRAMVAAAAASADAGAGARGAPPPLTAETVAVLRCARIETNRVVSSGGSTRIERKVVGRADLAQLGLGRLATAAVEEIAGTRCKGGVLTVVGDRFASSEENVAWVVGQLGLVVREARRAVGEDVDGRVLESWEEVVEAARSAVEGDSEEIREMVELMADGGRVRAEGAGVVVKRATASVATVAE
jgi:hypothetical protein